MKSVLRRICRSGPKLGSEGEFLGEFVHKNNFGDYRWVVFANMVLELEYSYGNNWRVVVQPGAGTEFLKLETIKDRHHLVLVRGTALLSIERMWGQLKKWGSPHLPPNSEFFLMPLAHGYGMWGGVTLLQSIELICDNQIYVDFQKAQNNLWAHDRSPEERRLEELKILKLYYFPVEPVEHLTAEQQEQISACQR